MPKLTGATLTTAKLSGADRSGARLAEAIWQQEPGHVGREPGEDPPGGLVGDDLRVAGLDAVERQLRDVGRVGLGSINGLDVPVSMYETCSAVTWVPWGASSWRKELVGDHSADLAAQ